MYAVVMENNEIYHHGIKGQKWGTRKYQNPDGTYTDAGLRRYWPNADHEGGPRGNGTGTKSSGGRKSKSSMSVREYRVKLKNDRLKAKADIKRTKQKMKESEALDKLKNADKYKEEKKAQRAEKLQKTKEYLSAHKKQIAMAAVGTAIAVYGAHSYSKFIKDQGAKIAADLGRKEYENLVKNGGTRITTDLNTASKRWGAGLYQQYNSNASTRQATRDVLDHLGNGGKISGLASARDYGIQTKESIARKAARAAVTTAKNSNAGKKISSAGTAIKTKAGGAAVRLKSRSADTMHTIKSKVSTAKKTTQSIQNTVNNSWLSVNNPNYRSHRRKKK